MTTTPASTVSFSPPVAQAPTASASATQITGTDSPFQTALAAATTQAQQVQQTQQANAAAANDAAATDAANADLVAQDAADAEAQAKLDAASAANDADLAGLLALAAQLLGQPANAAVAQATGQTTPATTGTPAPTTGTGTDNRTRADQLRLDSTSALLAATANANQNTANTATATTNTFGQAATPTATTNTAAAATNTNTATTTVTAAITVPPVAQEPSVAESATATALRGSGSSIPPQGQILANPNPVLPVPVDPSVTNPPVAEPAAPTPAAALPSAQLGDRPTTAGDRFAAIASAAAQLTPAQPPRSVAFSNTLDQTQATGAPPALIAGIVPGATAAGATATAPLLMPPFRPGASDTGTPIVLPLVNLGTQTTAAVVLPVQPTQSAADIRRSDDAITSATTGTGAPPPLAPFEAYTAPVTAPAAVAATPAAQVADAVVAHAHVLERDGATEFHMRLDPPDLGRVQIRLVTRGDEVHGQVLVANDAVRQMMESQMPDLRQRLEAAGVNVQQFNVSTDAGSGGNQQNAYREAALPGTAPRTAATNAAIAPRARIGRLEAGSLDVTV